MKLLRKSSDKLSPLWILLPIAVSLAVLWHNFTVPGLTGDSTIFLQIARNILLGEGMGWQALWVPPLHGILIACAAYLMNTDDLLRAVGMVSLVQGALLIPLVYGFALTVFDRRTAVTAALFSAVFPHLVWLSFYPESEITYTFLQTASLWAFFLAVSRRSYLLAASSGLLFSLAYLARSEGFVVMGIVLACVCIAQGKTLFRSPVLRICLVAVAAFVLTASPYLLYLRHHYGAWVISPKTAYVMIWMKGHTYRDHDKGEQENEELWGLNSEGKLRWMEPKGVGDLVGYLMADPAKSLRVYGRNLAMHMPGRIPNNSGMERYPQVFPIYFALLAVIAAYSRWKGAFRGERAVLLAPFSVILVLSVFTEGWWRYVVPYSPLLLMLASRGLWSIVERMEGRLSGWAGKAASLLAIVAIFLLCSYFLAVRELKKAPVNEDIALRGSIYQEQQKAAEHAVRAFGAGANYMAGWSKIVYFLDGLWTALPVGKPEDILRYGKSNGAQYVVLELGDNRLPNDYLARLMPGTQLAGVYRSRQLTYSAAFYRIL